MSWVAIEPDVRTVLAAHPGPLASLARGDAPAIVLRGAYPAEHCAALIERFVERGLMDSRLLEADSVQPRRVDIGTSLSNRAADKEAFLAHAQETRTLFTSLFAGRPDPVKLVYERLQQLAAAKRVTTAYESDGGFYGPAIFRIHYAGHRYQPHVDHAGKHERRLDYAVSRFAQQFAGVLCMQNSRTGGHCSGGHRSGGRVAQSILHRCLWTPELEPCLQAGRIRRLRGGERRRALPGGPAARRPLLLQHPPGARGAGAGGLLAARRAGGLHRLLGGRSGGVRLVVKGAGGVRLGVSIRLA